MSLTRRTRLYNIIEVVDTDTKEFDYLNSSLNGLSLSTVSKVRINSVFEKRPDLLSYKVFGVFDLGWLIAYHNDFLDPVEDLVIGKEVNIPSLDEYYRFVARNSKNRTNVRNRR